jgi:large subunit ribosomal protein L3
MTRATFTPSRFCSAGPCVITQLKTKLADGYDAAQLGLVEFVKESKVTKAQRGHFAKTARRRCAG